MPLASHANLATTPAFSAQWETVLRIGTDVGSNSLNTSTPAYDNNYGYAAVGLAVGQYVDFGQLSSPPNIEEALEFEEVEAGNLKNSGLYQVTTEGLTVTIPVQEFKPDIIEQALQNGTKYTGFADGDLLFTAGGTCNIKERPLSIDAFNTGCYAQSAINVATGIRGFMMTIYSGYLRGWSWGELNPSGLNTVDLEYIAIPDLTKPLGNRLYSLVVY